MKLKGLSLFACGGIGEYYLSKNNIEIVVANELVEERANFYHENYPSSNMIIGDITDKENFNKIVSESLKLGVDYIQATPPCQGMSTAGQMKESDPRNSLILYVIKAIKKIKPKYVLIENVPKFLKQYIFINGKSRLILDYLKLELKDYNINYDVLNAADYGTPQNRKRAILLLSLKKEKEWKIPKKTTIKHKTVRDAIGHLPSLESGEISNIPYHNAKIHNERHILWMKNTPTGQTAFNNEVHYPQKENGIRIKGFNNTYKRIEWDKPCPTITMANGVVSSQENVHPGRLLADGTYSDARVLTIHELILLTGLDLNWRIPENTKENLIRNLIGEAVPPLLSYELTKQLKN